MDAWIWRQAGKPYDKDAEWARAGKVILPLLQNMLCDPYFSQPAPKSTGREYFNYGWLERHLRHFPGVDPRDVQATLAAQKSPPPMPLALVAMTWKHWRSPGLPGERWRDYQEICLPSLAQARRRYWGLFSPLTRDIRVN